MSLLTSYLEFMVIFVFLSGFILRSILVKRAVFHKFDELYLIFVKLTILSKIDTALLSHLLSRPCFQIIC